MKKYKTFSRNKKSIAVTVKVLITYKIPLSDSLIRGFVLFGRLKREKRMDGNDLIPHFFK